MKEFQITENEAGQRFDKYLAKLLRNAPKSFFIKCFAKKHHIKWQKSNWKRKAQHRRPDQTVSQ